MDLKKLKDEFEKTYSINEYKSKVISDVRNMLENEKWSTCDVVKEMKESLQKFKGKVELKDLIISYNSTYWILDHGFLSSHFRIKVDLVNRKNGQPLFWYEQEFLFNGELIDDYYNEYI